MNLLRVVLACAALSCFSAPARPQDFSGLARLDAANSGLVEARGGIVLTLALSQPVPWRVVSLDAPRRLVLDFRTIEWGGADLSAMIQAEGALGIRTGEAGDGWSRLVIDLAEPFAVSDAGMTTEAGGGARLMLRLERVDEAAFAAAASRLPSAEPARPGTPPLEGGDDGPFVVAIDPGHGGIDPGAERDGLNEADLMLALALEFAEAVARAGMVPVLTRSEDVFVPLATRMTIARSAGADVLISLHADALEEDEAFGASVYTLSAEAVDEASERMVERHERGDLLSGLDLADMDDTVATALLDLARQDTTPASRRLAETVVAGLQAHGARVNSRPHREAKLAVLNAADFPSVLVEVGFLSDAADRERLASPEGRAPIVAGLLSALGAWGADQSARETMRMR